MNKERFGVALDIGTTTVSASLVDLETLVVLDSVSQLNEQRLFGTDVINRINAAEKGKTEKLFKLINGQTQKILEDFVQKWNISKIKKLSVSGNTVMLHLFLNTNPAGMGKVPFTPVFLEERELKGEELGLCAQTVSVLPSIAAFIGADVTAGLAVLDINKESEPSLLVDIGTNCEMALANGGTIFCCSAAAGPAFERPGISSGSDLIDEVADLLNKGIIEESGYLPDTPGLKITGEDVRDFQLAKSAVFSGINILCKNANLQINEIKNVYLAGKFGFNINIENAVTTGLFPKEFIDRTKVCGNLSLKGAIENLTDKNFIQKCNKIKESCSVINLALEPSFTDEFFSNMPFTV